MQKRNRVGDGHTSAFPLVSQRLLMWGLLIAGTSPFHLVFFGGTFASGHLSDHDMSWWMIGQSTVALLVSAVGFAVSTLRGSDPERRGKRKKKTRPPGKTAFRQRFGVRVAAAWSLATFLACLVGVSSESFPERLGDALVGTAVAALVQSFAALVGVLVGMLVPLPVVLIWRGVRNIARWKNPGEAIGGQVQIAFGLLLITIGVVSTASAFAYDSPYRRDLGPVFGWIRHGVVVHSEPFLWVTRGLVGLLVLQVAFLAVRGFRLQALQRGNPKGGRK